VAGGSADRFLPAKADAADGAGSIGGGVEGVAECRAYAEQFGWPKIARRVMEVYAAASRPL